MEARVGVGVCLGVKSSNHLYKPKRGDPKHFFSTSFFFVSFSWLSFFKNRKRREQGIRPSRRVRMYMKPPRANRVESSRKQFTEPRTSPLPPRRKVSFEQ